MRLTLRMSRDDASAVLAAARFAGQTPGDFVAKLLTGQPAPMPASDRTETVGALIASCAELSTFSRNLSHLVSLLRQGAFRPAEEYRPMLASLGTDVHRYRFTTWRWAKVAAWLMLFGFVMKAAITFAPA